MSSAAAQENSHWPAPGSVVGSVSQAGFASLDWEAAAQACDIVEFRLDAYPQSAADVRDAMAHNPRPSLLAARDPREGGLNALGLSPRLALLQSLADDADLVDIEIANLGLFRTVAEQVKEDGKIIIGSFHDFHGMPALEVLRDLIAEAAALGADVVKLAVTPRSFAEVASLASLLEEAPAAPLSLMGMGEFGKISRLVLGQLGSVLNYGYLDAATVPGQWPAAELKRLLTDLRA